MKETLGIKGKLTLELIRDGKVIESQKVDNVVTDDGKALIALLVTGAGTTFSHMAIGTDATTAAATDSGLGAEAGRVTLTSSSAANNVITYIGDFPAGTGTGTISEAGIFNAASVGTMLNRATFSPITKTAADALKITWQVTYG
jgi:negative regulator of sigma E activity